MPEASGSLLARAFAPARYAIASTMAVSALPGAMRPRLTLAARLIPAGYLGHLYHALGIPFELTPLLSLPAVLAGALFLHDGPIWLGVLLSSFHAVNDVADGVAMGLAIDPLPEGARPRGRMAIRRFLDTYVVDVAAKFFLFGVFALRLRETGQAPAILLLAWMAMEVILMALAGGDAIKDRRRAFHYEFVLVRGEGRRLFGRHYPILALGENLATHHVYCLLPLLGYLAPLEHHGRVFFLIVFAARAAILARGLHAKVVRLGHARATDTSP